MYVINNANRNDQTTKKKQSAARYQLGLSLLTASLSNSFADFVDQSASLLAAAREQSVKGRNLKK